MDLKKEFATNKQYEQEGVWTDIGNGCSIKIARVGNEHYTALFRKLSKPYQNQIRRGTLPNDKAEDLLIQVMAESIVLDWKGLEEDGKPVKYSRETCARILKEYKDFRELVSDLSNSLELFKAEMDAEAEKNSRKS